jgi:hypothetical protein
VNTPVPGATALTWCGLECEHSDAVKFETRKPVIGDMSIPFGRFVRMLAQRGPSEEEIRRARQPIARPDPSRQARRIAVASTRRSSAVRADRRRGARLSRSAVDARWSRGDWPAANLVSAAGGRIGAANICPPRSRWSAETRGLQRLQELGNHPCCALRGSLFNRLVLRRFSQAVQHQFRKSLGRGLSVEKAIRCGSAAAARRRGSIRPGR